MCYVRLMTQYDQDDLFKDVVGMPDMGTVQSECQGKHSQIHHLHECVIRHLQVGISCNQGNEADCVE